MTNENDTSHDAIPSPRFSEKQCFLCQTVLTTENRTAEHVIPKWLQARFDLWDEQIWLINGTSIPYRMATIPCCKACNNGPLSELESEVKSAFDKGVLGVRSLPEYRLFQWCSKIFYGLFIRENRLDAVRSNPSAGPIVKAELLQELSTFHFFLQSIRRPFIFDGFQPFSIFVVETLTYDRPIANYDYYDALLVGRKGESRVSLSFAIRAGSVGVICVFQDNGAQKENLQFEFDKFREIPLHPCQFIEFASLSIYKASLLAYVPKYVSIEDADRVVVSWEIPTVESVWHEWEPTTFEKLFTLFLGRFKEDIGEIYTPEGRHSFLYDGCDPIQYDRDGNRIPTCPLPPVDVENARK